MHVRVQGNVAVARAGESENKGQAHRDVESDRQPSVNK